jgi:hypothetical protein|nr:MAG TPA: hypothetical protein [Caudoviricetes sp.]
MKKVKEINTNEYFNKYSRRQRKIKNLSQAAQIALDTRKFEIELYWKRATYFWTFISADIAAFALIYARMGASVERSVLMALFSFLGILFSVGWYFVNRGSKYWQENWEDHIGFLITKEAGPIFKYRKTPKDKFKKINGAYPFSVSKVNQFLSGMTAVFWLVLFELSSFSFLRKYELSCCCTILCILLINILLIAILYWMFKFSMSENAEEVGRHDKDVSFIEFE